MTKISKVYNHVRNAERLFQLWPVTSEFWMLGLDELERAARILEGLNAETKADEGGDKGSEEDGDNETIRSLHQGSARHHR